MADLKTNYVDDVLDTSVNGKRKYNMIQNADGTVSFDDVTTYTQNGDLFGAKDVNDTNTAVNELNENLTAFDVDTQTYSTETFKFAKSGEDLGMLDEEGNFMAFGGSGKIYYIGEVTADSNFDATFDLKNISDVDYTKLTIRNFIVSASSCDGIDLVYGFDAHTSGNSISQEYDASTGILTVKNCGQILSLHSTNTNQTMTAKQPFKCKAYVTLCDIIFR